MSDITCRNAGQVQKQPMCLVVLDIVGWIEPREQQAGPVHQLGLVAAIQAVEDQAGNQMMLRRRTVPG